MEMLSPCPKCKATNPEKVNYTWWGGFLGPKLLCHVRCTQCKTVYNGRIGNSNYSKVIIYIIIVPLFVFFAFYITFKQMLPA